MSFFYIVSKLFTYLVLPPGMFILLLFFASIYAKKFRLFLFLASLSFYLLSTSFVSDFLLSSLENPYRQTAQTSKADAVVVLGGGHIEGSPNLPLAPSAYKRAMYGLMLAKSHDVPLLFSGAGLNTGYSEADAFLDSIEEVENSLHVKIPNKSDLKPHGFCVLVEDKSLDTFENAKFSKALFDKFGFKEPIIYLVTSAFHMKRSVKIYKHFGFNVIPMATDFKVSAKEKNIWDYFPNMWSLANSYTALHEYFGILSLVLKGIY